MNNCSTERPKRNGKRIPNTILNEGWKTLHSLPPKDNLLPSENGHLNNEVPKTIGKRLNLKTTRGVSYTFGRITLKKTARASSTSKPHLNTSRNRKAFSK